MGKKYQIDFDNGCANYHYTTPNGVERVSRLALFTDWKGIKVFTRNGVEYLTEENSEVL